MSIKKVAIAVGAGVVGLFILAYVISFFTGKPKVQQVAIPVYKPRPVVTVGQGSASDTSTYYFNGNPNKSGSKALSDQMEVEMQDGKNIIVNNFISAKTTIPDPNDSTRFYLAGGLDPAGSDSSYSIYYTTVGERFTIVLLQAPFAGTRVTAEQDFLEKLGIGIETACKLKYQVVIPSWVSSTYAGQDVGFDFCPGSVRFDQ